MNATADVLLINEDQDGTEELAAMLSQSGYTLVASIGMKDDMQAAVQQYAPDIVMVKARATNIFFMNQIYTLNQQQPRPVVIFADESETSLIDGAIKAGVSAYVVDGLSRQRLKPILQVAQARFSQEQSLRQELARTKSQLEERKVIERAKGIVMQRKNLSEDEAYRALRKLAMNRNQKLIDVANDVVTVSELLI